MTKQFTGYDTRRLVKAATVKGHPKFNGATPIPGTEEPFKADDMDGAIFCDDKHGDVFVFVGRSDTASPSLDKTVQPILRAGGSRYFRDYWRSVSFNTQTTEELAPYFASLAQGEYER